VNEAHPKSSDPDASNTFTANSINETDAFNWSSKSESHVAAIEILAIDSNGKVTIVSNITISNFTFIDAVALPGSETSQIENLKLLEVEKVWQWDRGF